MFRHFTLSVSFLLMLAGTGLAADNRPDSAKVGAVLSGALAEANAAWWGFDPADATPAVQQAIDSGARRVVVPYMGEPWVVRPLRLRGGLELVLEPGVVLLAKAGEYLGTGDSMLTAVDLEDITIIAHGAVMRMRKADYTRPPYKKAEWRMVLDMQGCRRVRLEGGRYEGSGGDGIYVGASAKLPRCEDVVIRDVACHDNHRQGISVISARNLLIERCAFSGTGGTAPEAGIDLEPNSENECLENVVVRRCRMEGNEGAGILLYLKNLKKTGAPVSIRFEDCHVAGGKDVGIGVGALCDDGVAGTVEFIRCTVEKTKGGAVYLYDKSPEAALVRFENCSFNTREMSKGADFAPLRFHIRRTSIAKDIGGVEFSACHVYDDGKRPALLVEMEKGKKGAAKNITGNIYLHNSIGSPEKYEMPRENCGSMVQPF